VSVACFAPPTTAPGSIHGSARRRRTLTARCRSLHRPAGRTDCATVARPKRSEHPVAAHIPDRTLVRPSVTSEGIADRRRGNGHFRSLRQTPANQQEGPTRRSALVYAIENDRSSGRPEVWIVVPAAAHRFMLTRTKTPEIVRRRGLIRTPYSPRNSGTCSSFRCGR